MMGGLVHDGLPWELRVQGSWRILTRVGACADELRLMGVERADESLANAVGCAGEG